MITFRYYFVAYCTLWDRVSVLGKPTAVLIPIRESENAENNCDSVDWNHFVVSDLQIHRDIFRLQQSLSEPQITDSYNFLRVFEF
jgi:hypothetical protein